MNNKELTKKVEQICLKSPYAKLTLSQLERLYEEKKGVKPNAYEKC